MLVRHAVRVVGWGGFPSHANSSTAVLAVGAFAAALLLPPSLPKRNTCGCVYDLYILDIYSMLTEGMICASLTYI